MNLLQGKTVRRIFRYLKEDFSMKEKYIKPDVELEEYKTLDVITTSGGDTEETDPWGAEPTPFG